ncbi:MAG: hypothetical protein R8P61_16485 [Bacteroidia bacterium]|nr:hypothetical protein [Bacteroidia bacterium]
MQKAFTILIMALLAIGIVPNALGQGTTTSTMNGRVTGDDGNGLAAATVIAIHGPTGS